MNRTIFAAALCSSWFLVAFFHDETIAVSNGETFGTIYEFVESCVLQINVRDRFDERRNNFYHYLAGGISTSFPALEQWSASLLARRPDNEPQNLASG
jgi:hypothetical protein